MKATIATLDNKFLLFNKPGLLEVNDRLTYAVKKLSDRYTSITKPLIRKASDTLTEFKVNHCVTGDRGEIVLDNQQYVFTPESQLLINKETVRVNDQLQDTEVDIEPFLIDPDQKGNERVKAVFDDFEMELLAGLLFAADEKSN